jgi:hypothetical protein
MTTGTPPQACVTYRDGEGRPHLYVLRSSPVVVGRDHGADIRLTWDGEVSRTHARLELVGDDPGLDWTLVDDGSSRNGSYLNGQPVRGRARLHDGDGVSVGRTLLVFRARPAADRASDARTIEEQFSQPAGATLFGRPHVTRAALSDSQFRVLLALAGPSRDTNAGLAPATDEQIAGKLFLNVETVRAHLQILYERFGVAPLPPDARRARLVEMARAGGLLVPGQER